MVDFHVRERPIVGAERQEEVQRGQARSARGPRRAPREQERQTQQVAAGSDVTHSAQARVSGRLDDCRSRGRSRRGSLATPAAENRGGVVGDPPEQRVIDAVPHQEHHLHQQEQLRVAKRTSDEERISVRHLREERRSKERNSVRSMRARSLVRTRLLALLIPP